MNAGSLIETFRADAVLGVGVPRPYSVATAETMAYAARDFMRWSELERGRRIFDADQAMVRSYVAYLLTTNARNKSTRRSPNTVYRTLTQVRAFCRWMVARGHMVEDPTDGIRGPRRLRTFVEPLGDHDLQAVIEACRRGRSPILAARNETLVYLLAFTGLRAAEVVGLRREDLEGRETVKVLGKGGKERVVALHQRVRSAIVGYLAMRWDSSPAAFVNQDGQPLSHAALRQALKSLGMQLRLRLGAHALRRTAFTKMAEAGFSEFELRAIGGWSTMTVPWQYVRRGAERNALKRHAAFEPVGD